jgi:hypothetical protein
MVSSLPWRRNLGVQEAVMRWSVFAPFSYRPAVWRNMIGRIRLEFRHMVPGFQKPKEGEAESVTNQISIRNQTSVPMRNPPRLGI